jgi:protease-4
MWSAIRDFDSEERRIFEENHWNGFNDWIQNVAEHRGMTFEEVEKLAHGRVWSGRQGKENGLVDDTGGLDRAIEIAKELAEIPVDEMVSIEHYPKKKSFFDILLGGGGGLAAASKYVIYRFIRDDLAETLDMVTTKRMHMMSEMEIE